VKVDGGEHDAHAACSQDSLDSILAGDDVARGGDASVHSAMLAG
jgi:hypothetical protein